MATARVALFRRLRLIAAMTVATTGLWLTAAGPTVACSCVEPRPIGEYATVEHAVFSGVAGPLDARGVPVRVDTWFHGPDPSPVLYLGASSFGDSAGCGTNTPPAGTAWIWVAFLAGGGADPSTNICTPSGQLGTPEGDALLAEAKAAFGGVAPPGTSNDPPESVPPPSVPADAGGLILAGTLGLGVVVLVGAGLLARRRPGRSG